MNERQYDCLRENRRSRCATRLGELRVRQKTGRPPAMAIVAKAARSLRQREMLAKAWSRVVDVALAEETDVIGLQDELLYVRASNASVAYTLGRKRPTIERQLRAVVPRLRGVRIVWGEKAVDETTE